MVLTIFAILLILLVGMFLIFMLIGLATSLMPEKEKERNLTSKDYNYKKQTLKAPPQKKEKKYSFLKKQWLEELAEDENEEGV